MKKAILFLLDDENSLLNSLERDLRPKYGKKYRILKVLSSSDPIQQASNLKSRNEEVAMFIVDQRMPELTGVEFLNKVRKIYPSAKKILLTAYADTEVAIESINQIGLDYYLTKPWEPPEDKLYPVLDDILGDWEANFVMQFTGIRVVGTEFSRHSHLVKDFLARNGIPYQWKDIDEESDMMEYLKSLDLDDPDKLPVVFLENGEKLIQPDNNLLAEKITGIQTHAEQPFYDLIVIGGGPAGLGAGVYAGSEGLRTVILEKIATGGQAGTSSRIENYLGFPNGISGGDLARRATSQAKRFGTEILIANEVEKVEVDYPYKIIHLSNGETLKSYAVIVATGVEVNTLNVEGIDKLYGLGIFYGAAMSEAATYRDKEIFIIGGGNSAGQGAIFFAKYASKVNIMIRRKDLSETMSQYLIDYINETDNIELIPYSELVEVKGEEKLEEIVVKNNQTNEIKSIKTTGLFIFIGAKPRTELLGELLDRDPAGYIKTGQDLYKGRKRPKNWPLD
ncbi:MAG: FAD-dependent oxidoreductase, partial [Candidatus Heimdallarchaeota archaeon]|nr:FAD-dependent oxidoreductase [Candidatus Heimdallarchaeota archaeon]